MIGLQIVPVPVVNTAKLRLAAVCDVDVHWNGASDVPCIFIQTKGRWLASLIIPIGFTEDDHIEPESPGF